MLTIASSIGAKDMDNINVISSVQKTCALLYGGIYYYFPRFTMNSVTILTLGGSPGDVSEAKRRRSERRVGEWAVAYVKQRKGWRMSCDVGKATEGLENALCRRK